MSFTIIPIDPSIFEPLERAVELGACLKFNFVTKNNNKLHIKGLAKDKDVTSFVEGNLNRIRFTFKQQHRPVRLKNFRIDVYMADIYVNSYYSSLNESLRLYYEASVCLEIDHAGLYE